MNSECMDPGCPEEPFGDTCSRCLREVCPSHRVSWRESSFNEAWEAQAALLAGAGLSELQQVERGAR